MSDPYPKPGELWEIRGLVDNEIAPRIILVTRVYDTLVYTMVDGIVDGSVLSLGTGWLLRRLEENEE